MVTGTSPWICEALIVSSLIFHTPLTFLLYAVIDCSVNRFIFAGNSQLEIQMCRSVNDAAPYPRGNAPTILCAAGTLGGSIRDLALSFHIHPHPLAVAGDLNPAILV